MTPAPIAIFAYNRPAHVERLLASLARNPEFEQSPVVIYCDGPKGSEQVALVEETRARIRQLAPRRARIVERDQNFGLARSIITGVTELTEAYGRAIVAEDDLVLSRGALGFLNAGLERYADAERVTHVAAYMYPVGRPLPEAFFYREGTCWGWGTWSRAWRHFEPNAHRLVDEIDRRNLRFDFDISGSMYFYQMLLKQRAGEIDSWAIRWYATNFLRGGLSLHPGTSYVENLGFDGTGVHCKVDARFVVTTTDQPVQSWPEDISESQEALSAMIAYRLSHASIKRTILQRLQQKFHRQLYG